LRAFSRLFTGQSALFAARYASKGRLSLFRNVDNVVSRVYLSHWIAPRPSSGAFFQKKLATSPRLARLPSKAAMLQTPETSAEDQKGLGAWLIVALATPAALPSRIFITRNP